MDGNSDVWSNYVPLTIQFDLVRQEYVDNDATSMTATSCQTLSESTLSAIVRWAEECSVEHVSCWHSAEKAHATQERRGFPTRLIDIGLQSDDPSIRLVETEHLDQHTSYVTLSHCWGTQLLVKLVKDNYAAFLQRIAFQALSKVFQDAIVFTWSLGIRYIWIDALCIVQDSIDDWNRESIRMSMVYSFGYLNIAATSSSDGRSTIFPVKEKAKSEPCIIASSWTGHSAGNWLCSDGTTWRRKVSQAPLNTRAWVFQERMLAPRTVHFASDQLWWECRAVRSNETYPEGVPLHGLQIEVPLVQRLAEFEDQTTTDANDLWLSLVETYTEARLTRDSDRLVAIAGVVQVVADMMRWNENEYLAGIWKHDLLVDLLWRMRASGTRNVNSFAAPSWSWASVKGAVTFSGTQHREKLRTGMSASLVSSTINTENSMFGPIKQGSHLVIAAYLYPIRLSDPVFDLYPCMSKLELGRQPKRLLFDSDHGFAESLDEDDQYFNESESGIEAFWCLFATYTSDSSESSRCSEGLILKRDPDPATNAYQRIGWLRLFHDNDEVLDVGNQLHMMHDQFQSRQKDDMSIIRLG